jgi:L-threonylcarbamoyladenylate synthase
LGNAEDLEKKYAGLRIAHLYWNKSSNSELDRTLSQSSNLREAAHNLFGFMRELDSSEADIIIAEPVPHEGIGKAINDRLKRAAAQG